jgi:hypothetical protein
MRSEGYAAFQRLTSYLVFIGSRVVDLHLSCFHAPTELDGEHRRSGDLLVITIYYQATEMFY